MGSLCQMMWSWEFVLSVGRWPSSHLRLRMIDRGLQAHLAPSGDPTRHRLQQGQQPERTLADGGMRRQRASDEFTERGQPAATGRLEKAQKPGKQVVAKQEDWFQMEALRLGTQDKRQAWQIVGQHVTAVKGFPYQRPRERQKRGGLGPF